MLEYDADRLLGRLAGQQLVDENEPNRSRFIDRLETPLPGVGDEAVIQAKVTAGTIVCKGKITGDIAAKERVKLRAPAVFNGSMKTPMLSIEDGVLFNGGLEMTQGAREVGTLHPVAATPSQGVKLAG